MSYLFLRGGQSIGTSASASVPPMNIQGWFPVGLTGLISLQSNGLSRVLSSTTIWKYQFFASQPSFYGPTLISIHGKTTALTIWTFVSKVMSLLFNTLFMFVIPFLPRSKHLLILWLQSPPAVILEPKKIKSATVSTFSPSICQEVMGPDVMILLFFNVEFQANFFTLLFHSNEEAFQFLFTFCH